MEEGNYTKMKKDEKQYVSKRAVTVDPAVVSNLREEYTGGPKSEPTQWKKTHIKPTLQRTRAAMKI